MEDGESEVCATVEGSFDEEKSEAELDLECFVRPTDPRVKERHLIPEWLPLRQSIREKVAQEDANALAREIFHHWVGRVRRSIPSTVDP